MERERTAAVTAGTTLVPYGEVFDRFRASPPGKLFCLHGTGAVFRLSLNVAARGLAAGFPVTLIDGTNRFDVYYLAEFARRLAQRQLPSLRRSPEEFLRNIYVSRAFTCFQMEAVITDRLPAFVQARQSPVVLIFGLLDTFYDEQAPLHEVRAGLRRIIATLRMLKARNIALLLASADLRPASEERRDLFPTLAAAMDRVYRVGEQGKIEHGGGNDGTHSTDIHHGSPAGNGQLVEIPPRAAAGRSGSTGRPVPGRAAPAGGERLCRTADTLRKHRHVDDRDATSPDPGIADNGGGPDRSPGDLVRPPAARSTPRERGRDGGA